MADPYDVIVIGARCAGSPTAMLLARRGYRVLVVDKATFPSDTISTHLIHPPGIEALKRWGLLERVVATGCPAIRRYTLDLGPFAITGNPGTQDAPASYAPRRTVLDKILVDAASEAGAEVREGFNVEEILVEDGRVTGIRGGSQNGRSISERARVVVGADGLHSLVAKTVAPRRYHEKPALQVSYYSYWSGLPLGDGFEAYDRGDRGFAAWATNDGLTLLIVGWPYDQLEANRTDIEGTYRQAIDRAPGLAERLRGAKREERFYGMAVPNYFLEPFGPGWALVGDAGYNKDFITAQGISDAFRDAERCVGALDASFSGSRSFEAAMAGYQSERDARLPTYEFTCQFAALQPPPPERQQLMAAIHGNHEAMEGFIKVFAGVTSPATFFTEENVARIFAAAG